MRQHLTSDQLKMEMVFAIVAGSADGKNFRNPMGLMNQLLDPHFSSSDPRVNLRQLQN